MTTVRLLRDNKIKLPFLFDFQQVARSVYLRPQFYLVARGKFNK